MGAQFSDVPPPEFGTEVLAVVGLLFLFHRRGWM
jgi:hypothetical protein